jgi:hypothetical protein
MASDSGKIAARNRSDGNRTAFPYSGQKSQSDRLLGGVNASKGVFVTTSDFSADAKEYIRRVAHRIVLINGSTLARLMIQHDVGVRVTTTYKIRSVDEDYFSDLETGAASQGASLPSIRSIEEVTPVGLHLLGKIDS